jgi:hypothetical protein
LPGLESGMLAAALQGYPILSAENCPRHVLGFSAELLFPGLVDDSVGS